MGYLRRSASAALNAYKRKGGKQNRSKQAELALRFVDYLERVERLRDWDHLGQNQIIRFYKRHRHLTGRTISNYYYAIRTLCDSLELAVAVPAPNLELHGPSSTSSLSVLDNSAPENPNMVKNFVN